MSGRRAEPPGERSRRVASRSAERLLEEMQLLTDTSLSRLDVDDLLVALLDRTLEALASDTAAVLLLDEGGQFLVARAARGVEEEVRQGVRVPVGAGFAGRIAADRRPVSLDRVDETTVTNPVLWEKGIAVILGVPLLQGDRAIGVLHVGRFAHRPYTAVDIRLLETVADRVAAAVERGTLEAERASARVLQRSLLPAELPRIPGLLLGSRYVPSEFGEVGGDWYDAFVLPGGDVWTVIGDVAGHGLRPAVVMGRLRSALRAYALDGMPPAQALAQLDRFLQQFEVGVTATVICAAAHPPYDTFHLASAGHLPPVLARPDGSVEVLAMEPAPLMGVVGEPEPATATVEMPVGSSLLLYTDGLVERRGESLDTGLARLEGAMVADEPERICRRVMDSLIGAWVPEDDVAVLVVQRVPTPDAAGRA